MELDKHKEELLVRFIAGELNDQEKIQVRNWLDESVENRKCFEEMNKYYQLSKLTGKPGGFNLEEGWARVKAEYYKRIYLERFSKPEKTPIQRIAIWSLRIAAGFIILLGVYFGGTLADRTKEHELAWAEIKAPAWSRVNFYLPDGTSGSLNSNSVLRYNLNFSDKREIELTGEAYFEVYKDLNRPFRLNTNYISLEVTGTSFNVASYPNDDQTEVVLAEGSLNLSDRANSVNYKVVPSDLFIYSRMKKSFRREVVQTEKYTAWTQGKLVFRNDPIDEVARRLGRWYNVDVEVKPGEYSDLRLRATFIDENLEEVLKLLKLNLPINYKIEKREQDSDGTYQKTRVIISLRK